MKSSQVCLAVHEGELAQVLREVRRPLLRLGHLAEEVGEGERRRDGQVEVEDLEDEVLHAQDLLLRVRVVRDVHELPHLGRVDLLVFPAIIVELLDLTILCY